LFASLLAACTRLSQSTHRAASSAQHITAATAFSHASHWTFILKYLFLSVPPPRPRTRAAKFQMPHLQSLRESPPPQALLFSRPLDQMPRQPTKLRDNPGPWLFLRPPKHFESRPVAGSSNYACGVKCPPGYGREQA
jgi:hypothetical protein